MRCEECKYSPKTYEEYCIGQSHPSMYCPDAYTEKSHLCGNYNVKEPYNLEYLSKALEQEPCEDCISRKSVEELISNNNDKYGYSDRFHEFTEECMKLPSVQPKQEPVIHAKWERHYTRLNVYADSFWHCSNCNFKTMSVNADKYYKYCPNCGARMIEPQESEGK